jgi:hypothetical protein
MPLVNALPIPVGNPWSSAAPQQALELITVWNLDELTALAAPPNPDLAWADVGTNVALGRGIVKFAHSMPSTLNFERFKPGGTRKYNTLDVVAARVEVNPYELSFGIPMIWDYIGNGWMLQSKGANDTLIDFTGVSGLGAQYVIAGKAYKCQGVASLFYEGMYCTGSGLSLTTPTQFAHGGAPQGLATGGIALFTDGTGAANSVGDQHYANPTVSSSGRFKNVWSAFGGFALNYGRSLTTMTVKPHATLPNKTSGARTRHTFGPTFMREKFWRMMVEDLTLTTATVSGNGVAAATTNPFSLAKTLGITEENFVGNAFGPRIFWILPELDNHPYCLANPGKDMWVNISDGTFAGQRRPSWAKLACINKEFVPVFRFYGPGDPRAMSELMMRFEGDLDAGFAGGAPGEIDVFFEV